MDKCASVFCNGKTGCIWSESDRFCQVLQKAAVPVDKLWPPLILYLRGIRENSFLSESQKAKMQEILLATLQNKKFTSEEYERIQDELSKIMRAPYEQKLVEITREVEALSAEVYKILGNHKEDIILVADSVDSELHKGSDPFEILSHLRNALRDVAEKIEKDTVELLDLSHKDSLTGLANRRSFDDFLSKTVTDWRITKEPVSLIMFDIDNFKNFNDTYGHLVGDQVLRTLAAQVRRVTGDIEKNGTGVLAARYGGEEFAVILRGAIAEQAPTVAEDIRKAIHESALLLKDSDGNVVESGLHVTVSLGIAPLWDGWGGMFDMNLVDAADKALYHAKKSGKNCTVQFFPGREPRYTVIPPKK